MHGGRQRAWVHGPVEDHGTVETRCGDRAHGEETGPFGPDVRGVVAAGVLGSHLAEFVRIVALGAQSAQGGGRVQDAGRGVHRGRTRVSRPRVRLGPDHAPHDPALDRDRFLSERVVVEEGMKGAVCQHGGQHGGHVRRRRRGQQAQVIGAGERVEEGDVAGVQQGWEQVPIGVVTRAAAHPVLQHVRHTGVFVRWRGEGQRHRETVGRGVHMDMPQAGGRVRVERDGSRW